MVSYDVVAHPVPPISIVGCFPIEFCDIFVEVLLAKFPFVLVEVFNWNCLKWLACRFGMDGCAKG